MARGPRRKRSFLLRERSCLGAAPVAISEALASGFVPERMDDILVMLGLRGRQFPLSDPQVVQSGGNVGEHDFVVQVLREHLHFLGVVAVAAEDGPNLVKGFPVQELEDRGMDRPWLDFREMRLPSRPLDPFGTSSNMLGKVAARAARSSRSALTPTTPSSLVASGCAWATVFARESTRAGMSLATASKHLCLRWSASSRAPDASVAALSKIRFVSSLMSPTLLRTKDTIIILATRESY